MDCHEEVAILERRLKKLVGVEALQADVLGQRLKVAYDAARVDTAAIAAAVAQTGMRAWLEHEEPSLSTSAATRHLFVAVSGISLAVGLIAGLAGASRTVQIAAFAVAIGSGSIDTGRRALAAARSLALDMNVLMLIAVIGAVALRNWSEAASVIFLFALAQLLEARAMDRARVSIRSLMDLAPTVATVRRGGAEERLPVDDVRRGDIVIVGPGEKIPLDGEVASGHSAVNQAPVTGESLPAEKQAGDVVFGGTINGHGSLEIRVTHVRADSTIAHIIHLVERAQAQRAPSQTFVERFARIYTPAVLVMAVLIAIIPPVVAHASWTQWIYRSLVLLVIACPCALVISTPVSVVSALSAAARKGVLVKGGAHLERLARVRCIAFDKTGTLTTGVLKVTAVTPVNGASPDRVLQLAASVERRSEHPIGRAIVEHAAMSRISIEATSGFQALPGLGAEAVVGTARVLLGNHRLFETRGICSDDVHAILDGLTPDAQTYVIVGTHEEPLGIIGVADEVRHSARDAVQLLRDNGVGHIALLTGDHGPTARAMAADLGIDEVRADLLPADKVGAVAALRAKHGPTAMVGDGVNDAPALAAADVGIAMGVIGSDAALETADIALMSDELLRIPYAVRLSRAMTRNIRFNIATSIVLKALFLVLAVLGLATLWMAVIADTGVSLLVVANALRLLKE